MKDMNLLFWIIYIRKIIEHFNLNLPQKNLKKLARVQIIRMNIYVKIRKELSFEILLDVKLVIQMTLKNA